MEAASCLLGAALSPRLFQLGGGRHLTQLVRVVCLLKDLPGAVQGCTRWGGGPIGKRQPECATNIAPQWLCPAAGSAHLCEESLCSHRDQAHPAACQETLN